MHNARHAVHHARPSLRFLALLSGLVCALFFLPQLLCLPSSSSSNTNNNDNNSCNNNNNNNSNNSNNAEDSADSKSRHKAKNKDHNSCGGKMAAHQDQKQQAGGGSSGRPQPQKRNGKHKLCIPTVNGPDETCGYSPSPLTSNMSGADQFRPDSPTAPAKEEETDGRDLLADFAGPRLPIVSWDELEIVPNGILGGGQFGIVRQARWRGTTVAVKSLRKRRPSARELQDFRREALFNMRLGRHARVVSCIGGDLGVPHLQCALTNAPSLSHIPSLKHSESGLSETSPTSSTGEGEYEEDLRTAPVPYLVLEYMPGNSLQQRLQRVEAPVPPATQLRMMLDACAAVWHLHAEGIVWHLHAEGIVHRDVAARNFLVDEQDRVYICDFGLSRPLPRASQVGRAQTVVAVPWSAPESLQHSHYSRESDIFSFGIFLWEVTTRSNVPYPQFELSKPGLAQISQAVVEEGLRPAIPEHTPPLLASLLEACWNADAAARPTIQEVHSRLLQLQDAKQFPHPMEMAMVAAATTSPVYQPREEASYTSLTEITPDSRELSLRPPLALGRGKHAEVFRGKFRGQSVAAKIYFIFQDPDQSDKDKVAAAARRVWREAEQMAELSAQCSRLLPFVGVLEAKVDMEGCPSFVVPMYLLTAKMDHTLLDEMKNHCVLEPSRALTVAMHIAEALAFLHSKGLIHGDVRPAHMMVRKGTEGDVVLGGLSTLQTGPFATLQQPASVYSAPEVRETKRVSPASDVYALVLSLVEFLSGPLRCQLERTPERAANRRKSEVSAEHACLLDPALVADRRREATSYIQSLEPVFVNVLDARPEARWTAAALAAHLQAAQNTLLDSDSDRIDRAIDSSYDSPSERSFRVDTPTAINFSMFVLYFDKDQTNFSLSLYGS
eukprot:g65570.t1